MLASSLIALAAIYGVGVAHLWRSAGVGRGISRAQALAFSGGWLTLVVALIGPLHEMSEQLLSAHMVQHELLMIVAAPLIAFSSPFVAVMWALQSLRYVVSGFSRTKYAFSRTVNFTHFFTAPATVWLLHALALWVWHLPSLYQAAVTSERIHAIQHSCFFGSACLFWWGIAHGRYGRMGSGAAVIYVFATALHSGALGALLTLSSALWYPIYATSTLAWGRTPLEDQQLAGLVMWIPPGVVFLVVGLGFLASWIKESERRVRIAES